MTTLIDLVQHPSIEALAWALIHFLWQGALLGGAAFAILRAGRPERATTRYAISVATLAAMMVAFATTVFILMRPQPVAQPEFATTAAGAFAKEPPAPIAGDSNSVLIPSLSRPLVRRSPGGGESLGEGESFDRVDRTMLSLIALAWMIGVVAMSIRLLGGWMVARRLATRAGTLVSPAIDAAARAIAAKLRIRRAVAILESQAVAVPTLVGWMKPVVLLPASALAGLSPDQLRAILAHELAHVRRHDYLVNLLQSCVETLLFYHPATWWVSARIRAEREHCCDDLAVEVCGDRLVYASALAELTSLAAPRSLALAATDGSLLNRVRRILGGQRPIHDPAPAWPLLAVVIVIAGAGSFDTTAERAVMPPIAAAAPGLTESPAAVVPARVGRPQTPTPAAEAAAGKPADSGQGAAEARRAQLVRELVELQKATKATGLHATTEEGRQALLEALAIIEASQPAPPAAPKAPEAPQELGIRGSGNMNWSDGTEKFSVRWTGPFRLSDDEKDIEWVAEGATVTFTDGMILTSRVELRGTRSGVERQYWRNGQRREYEPEGRAFLAAALDRMIRNSGAFAKERVARFLKRGGPDAVLAEIDRLSASSYVRRVYYTELLKQAPPSDALLGRVLQRVPNELKSDYDKATLLTEAAQLPVLNDSHRVAIARAVQSIASDYDQRRTLTAILTTRPVAPAVAAAVLEASDSINSSYDRAQILMAFVEHGGLTSATTPAFMAQLRRMSSYDQRRVLTAVSSSATLAGAVAVEAVRAAGAIPSSHDQSTTLISLIDRGGVTDATADAFFEAAGRISSSHDLSRVLLHLLQRDTVGARLVEGVLRTAPKISSGYNRAQVLIAVAGRGPLTGEARKLYIEASRNLGSHDENRVLAALVRAEAR